MTIAFISAALLGAVCSAPATPSLAPAPIGAWIPSEAAAALVEAPAAYFGRSVSTIQQVAGTPTGYSEELVVNQHERGLCNTVVRVEYPGIVLEVLVVPDGSRSFLQGVDLTRARPGLVLPITLGQSESSVTDTLGRPARWTRDGFTYEGPDYGVGANTVQLTFEDHRLVRIQWHYVID